MKHSAALGMAAAFTVWSCFDLSARAYVIGTSRFRQDRREQLPFKEGKKGIVFKVRRSAVSGDAATGKSNYSSVVGLILGLSLLGAVAPSAGANAAEIKGGAAPKMILVGPGDDQLSVLGQFLSNLTSKAAAASSLETPLNRNPIPYQDRNPRAFLDSDRRVISQEEIINRIKAQQRPGQRIPGRGVYDGDYRIANATFHVDYQ